MKNTVCLSSFVSCPPEVNADWVEGVQIIRRTSVINVFDPCCTEFPRYLAVLGSTLFFQSDLG